MLPKMLPRNYLYVYKIPKKRNYLKLCNYFPCNYLYVSTVVLTRAILVAWAIGSVVFPIGRTFHAFCATTAFVETLEIIFIDELDTLLKMLY